MLGSLRNPSAPRGFLPGMGVRTPLRLLFSGTLAASVHADQFSLLRSSVAPTGDVNGDGVPDFAVAQRGPGWRGGAKLGPEPLLDRVWILCGSDGGLIRTLRPPRCCEDFGRALADAGDVNGDGWADVVVHMPRLEEAPVLSGADLSILVSVKIPAPGPR